MRHPLFFRCNVYNFYHHCEDLFISHARQIFNKAASAPNAPNFKPIKIQTFTPDLILFGIRN